MCDETEPASAAGRVHGAVSLGRGSTSPRKYRNRRDAGALLELWVLDIAEPEFPLHPSETEAIEGAATGKVQG